MSTELPLIQAFLVVETSEADPILRKKMPLSWSFASAMRRDPFHPPSGDSMPTPFSPLGMPRDGRLVRLTWSSASGVELDLHLEVMGMTYLRLALPTAAGFAVWPSPLDLPVIPMGAIPTVEAISVGGPGRSVLTFEFAVETRRGQW